MKLLLTGATGFIGRRLLECLGNQYIVRVACRNVGGYITPAVEKTVVGDIDAHTNWQSALEGVNVVVHAAGRAHVGGEVSSLDLHREVNVHGTIKLMRQAVESGVSRFIFISSIGVNGNESWLPFKADDVPKPIDAYAISKFEAEQALWELNEGSQMEIVIIRPPLVYGPCAPGNFGRLMRAVQNGVPLPLGAVHNKRSFVALDNLVDLIARCCEHPAAANQIFLAGDGEDLSTTELLRRLGDLMGKPARLIPVPVRVLEMAAGVVGRRATIRKLCGNLQIDLSKTRELLGWTPPISVEEGLRRAVQCVPAAAIT